MLGRNPASVEITVLDLPVIGTDREMWQSEWSGSADGRRPPSTPLATMRHVRLIMRAAISSLSISELGTIFIALFDLAGG